MGDTSILIAYFSHSGKTQIVANHIRASLGGNLFRIETVDPYPQDYDAVVEIAGKEQKRGDRPRLTGNVVDIASYRIVFLGYPNWWSTMPMAVFTFLEAHDLSGKQIAPFCTHEGSGLARSVKDLREACPRSVILDGLSVRGGNARTAKQDVLVWLERIGVTTT